MTEIRKPTITSTPSQSEVQGKIKKKSDAPSLWSRVSTDLLVRFAAGLER